MGHLFCQALLALKGDMGRWETVLAESSRQVPIDLPCNLSPHVLSEPPELMESTKSFLTPLISTQFLSSGVMGIIKSETNGT